MFLLAAARDITDRNKAQAAQKILEALKLLGIKNQEGLEAEREKNKDIKNRVSKIKHMAIGNGRSNQDVVGHRK